MPEPKISEQNRKNVKAHGDQSTVVTMLLLGLVALIGNSKWVETSISIMEGVQSIAIEAIVSLSEVESIAKKANSSLEAIATPQIAEIPAEGGLPSLEDLVKVITNSTHPEHEYPCPEGTRVFTDTPLPPSSKNDKKIPKIIHVTGKSRCVTASIYKNLERWRFEGHGLYFHDDNAVHRLISYAILDHGGKGLVPNLERVMSCVTDGASFSDIWRYALLWYYGGIYTDMDNAPTGFNGTTIRPDDDAFAPIEGMGIAAQFFFATTPGHPWMLMTLHYGIGSLSKIVSSMRNNPAKHTGPSAFKIGFILFQRAIGIDTDGYLPAGIYNGAMFNGTIQQFAEAGIVLSGEAGGGKGNGTHSEQKPQRSITLVGSKDNFHQYVDRKAIRQYSKELRKMNMSHWHEQERRPKKRVSCLEHMERQDERVSALNLTLPSVWVPPTDMDSWWYPRYQKANYDFNGTFIEPS